MKLNNSEKIDLIINELELWSHTDNYTDNMVYALHNGYRLHAASLFLHSGCISDDAYNLVKDVKINKHKELKEIKEMVKTAFIYICPDCNCYDFYNDYQGLEIQCCNCGTMSKHEDKRTKIFNKIGD